MTTVSACRHEMFAPSTLTLTISPRPQKSELVSLVCSVCAFRLERGLESGESFSDAASWASRVLPSMRAAARGSCASVPETAKWVTVPSNISPTASSSSPAGPTPAEAATSGKTDSPSNSPLSIHFVSNERWTELNKTSVTWATRLMVPRDFRNGTYGGPIIINDGVALKDIQAGHIVAIRLSNSYVSVAGLGPTDDQAAISAALEKFFSRALG